MANCEHVKQNQSKHLSGLCKSKTNQNSNISCLSRFPKEFPSRFVFFCLSFFLHFIFQSEFTQQAKVLSKICLSFMERNEYTQKVFAKYPVIGYPKRICTGNLIQTIDCFQNLCNTIFQVLKQQQKIIMKEINGSLFLRNCIQGFDRKISINCITIDNIDGF